MPVDGGRATVTGRATLGVTFSRFGWRAVEGAAHDLGEAVDGFLGFACGFIVREIDRGRVRPKQVKQRRRTGQERTVTIDVPERIWARIVEIAERNGVSEAEVVEHAALALAAAVGSGAMIELLSGPEPPAET